MNKNDLEALKMLVDANKRLAELEEKIAAVRRFIWNEQEEKAENILNGAKNNDRYWKNQDYTDIRIDAPDILKIIGEGNSIVAEMTFQQAKQIIANIPEVPEEDE